MVSIPLIPVEDLATSAEAAPLCKSTPGTLSSWRRDGVHVEGREFIKSGNRVLYIKPILVAWLILRNVPDRYLAFVKQYLISVGMNPADDIQQAKKRLTVLSTASGSRKEHVSETAVSNSKMKLPSPPPRRF